MSDTSAFGFGQFVPGFDFLQNLSKTAAQAQPSAAAGMPGMFSLPAKFQNARAGSTKKKTECMRYMRYRSCL